MHQAIPRLLSLVAVRSGSPLVLTDVARSADLNRATARSYLTYLDIVFLTAEVPLWSTNLTSRLSKTPKAYVTDSGLAAHLLGASAADLRRTGHPAFGTLVETFVLTELMKLKPVTEINVPIWHPRDREGREIDFILEGPSGAVVGIEVKASASPGADAARHLRWLKGQLGDKFTARHHRSSRRPEQFVRRRHLRAPGISALGPRHSVARSAGSIPATPGLLCPRFRAGFCDGTWHKWNGSRVLVSMPSVSGWALRLDNGDGTKTPNYPRFLCPRFRAGLCDERPHVVAADAAVSMPSVSGWALRPWEPGPSSTASQRFLCPRFRARLCDLAI